MAHALTMQQQQQQPQRQNVQSVTEIAVPASVAPVTTTLQQHQQQPLHHHHFHPPLQAQQQLPIQGPMSSNEQGTVTVAVANTSPVPPSNKSPMPPSTIPVDSRDAMMHYAVASSDGSYMDRGKPTAKKNLKKTSRSSGQHQRLPSIAPASSSSVLPAIVAALKSPTPLILGTKCQSNSSGHANPATAVTVGSADAVSSSGAIPVISMATMQRWSLEKLDAHIRQYRAANQAVPHAVALLVADVRRKEEKRHAKRLANRKSACTSRARKKKLIDDMTRENSRLRRQALILSYLPDPVIAIRADGVITFCSMQVERVLRHTESELVGANIEDILVPSSRKSLRRLIRDMVLAEQCALLSSSSVGGGEEEEEDEDMHGQNRSEEEEETENISAATAMSAVMPHKVSEGGVSSEVSSLPPLLEVKVKADSTDVAAGEDVSDSSGDDKNKTTSANNKTSETSSLTHKNSSLLDHPCPRLESGADQIMKVANKPSLSPSSDSPSENMLMNTGEEKSASTVECDESTSCANKANASLLKNVEMCKLNKDNEDKEQVRFSHKDDVMGASVTANNADAKLSSLIHNPRMALDASGGSVLVTTQQTEEEDNLEHMASSAGSSSLKKTKKQSGNSSEDSGYRESNDSPEESNEYLEDSLSSSEASIGRLSSKIKRRRTRPLAPACNVRLIRKDLSSIWCELTSSIRTRPSNDNDNEFNIIPSSQYKTGNNPKAGSESVCSSVTEEKELLLCFRPTREGGTVGEELRFCSQIEKCDESNGQDSSEKRKVSLSLTNSSSSKDEVAFPLSGEVTLLPLSTYAKKNRPPKKRKYESDDDSQMRGRKRCSEYSHAEETDERSAVESMMSLAKHTI